MLRVGGRFCAPEFSFSRTHTVDEAEKRLTVRLDDTVLRSRMKLAVRLGELVEADDPTRAACAHVSQSERSERKYNCTHCFNLQALQRRRRRKQSGQRVLCLPQDCAFRSTTSTTWSVSQRDQDKTPEDGAPSTSCRTRAARAQPRATPTRLPPRGPAARCRRAHRPKGRRPRRSRVGREARARCGSARAATRAGSARRSAREFRRLRSCPTSVAVQGESSPCR